MKIAVLGAGMVGRTIAIDLSEGHSVTSFDVSPNSLALLAAYPNITCRSADLSAYDTYPELLNGFDFAVSAVPGFMGFRALQAIINCGLSVADISFFPEDALVLDSLAKEKNVTAITDCGVAPGLSNYFIGYFDKQFEVSDFVCLVGGLPKVRTKPFEYKAPFSPIDVIEEYTRPARLMENGQIVVKPALSEIEPAWFEEIGTLEAFNTDGLRSLLYTMNHIPNMKEKTLRYPGHADLMKTLQQAGFFDTAGVNMPCGDIVPLEFSAKVLLKQWKLLPEEEEFTVMTMNASGLKNGVKHVARGYLLDRYDPVRKLSSMSRTTGFTCAATLHLISGKIFDKKGVFPPEIPGADEKCFHFVMNYLQQRGVKFEITEE
jgi:lysine 6-dehydrogenase